MKIHSSVLLLVTVLGVFGVPNLVAASPSTTAKAFRINAVERYNQPLIERGTSEFTVRRSLGEPRRKLDSNTWAYDGFESCDWKIETGDCSTLLVRFANGKVTELKLINDGAEKVIAARLQTKSADRGVVASK